MKLNIQKFASGSFEFPNWSSGYAIRGKIEWSSTSSIESNSSVVTASIYVRRTSGYTTGKLWNGYVNIGGNNHTYSQIYTGTSTTVRQDWVLVQTFADTITHNADGTKTINISGQVTGPSGTGLEGKSSWGDSNVNLDTIPRASQPTLSSASVNMGNSVTITTNRVSNSFTHTISYSFGSASGTIATNVADSTTWTPPITLANQIPNSTSGTCTITCTTYNGDTLIGTKTVGLTLNVPSSVVPTVSIGTLTEANTTMQGLNWGVFVQNKSQLNIPITAAGSYSSTIASVVTTINNVTFNGTNVTTSILVTAGNNTISTTVTDSRGRTATTTKTYNVVAYSNPTITTVQAQRCLSDGTLSDEGTYLLYSFDGSISSVSNNNAHTFRIGHKLTSVSTYTYTNIDTSNYSINKSDQVLNLNLSTSNSYDIIFEAIDSFMTNAINRTIDTGFDLLNFNPSGKSMAIGKVSEAGANEELLEIGLPTEITGNTTIDGRLNINATGDAELNMKGDAILLHNNNGTTFIGAKNHNIAFRPVDLHNSSNQMVLDNSGNLTVTGEISTTGNDTGVSCDNQAIGRKAKFTVSGGGNAGIYDNTNNNWIIKSETNQNVSIPHTLYTQGLYVNGNDLLPVTIYDNTTGIQSGNYITINNLSSYKKLQITFMVYGASATNQGGASNIIWLDLTKNVSNTCRCGVVIPYLADSITGSAMGTDFRAVFEANLGNNRLYCFFAYGTQKQTGSSYIMTKVVGYKY